MIQFQKKSVKFQFVQFLRFSTKPMSLQLKVISQGSRSHVRFEYKSSFVIHSSHWKSMPGNFYISISFGCLRFRREELILAVL